MRARQHDAHVRARRRLLRRVVDRHLDWSSIHTRRRVRARLGDASVLDFWTDCAARALAAYDWPDGWQWRQTGRYHTVAGPDGSGYDGPKVLYKDVPTFVVHSLAGRTLSESRALLADD